MSRLFARFARFVATASAVFGAVAALRVHHRPSAADLREMGIEPKDFTVRF